eukprot:SAG31_NODE_2686_length_5253_cov_84.469926_3_plen_80_part_00
MALDAVTVLGAGAVGSHVAAHLCRAGISVNLIARGKNLAAIRERGAPAIVYGAKAFLWTTVTHRDAAYIAPPCVQDCEL